MRFDTTLAAGTAPVVPSIFLQESPLLNFRHKIRRYRT